MMYPIVARSPALTLRRPAPEARSQEMHRTSEPDPTMEELPEALPGGDALDARGVGMVDGERLRRLVRDHMGGVARYLARLGIPSGEVDDVAQEVFLVAASKLGSVPSGSDRPFLYAVASRVANNARRANMRRLRAHERYVDGGTDPAATPEELSDQLRARTLFDSALQDMSPELRGVFLMCEVEGLAIPEIARFLDVPTGTAASRLRRAREAFFDKIGRDRVRPVPRGACPRPSSDEGPEILSWWVSDGEVDALRAIVDIYQRSHPGAPVVWGGIRDTTTAKHRLDARMVEGAPPDTFQANGGQDLLRWARGNAAGSLEPLEFLFDDERWRAAFPADVLELVSCAGEAFAVPLGIHRTNTLVYDIQALDKAGLRPPGSLDELHAVAGSLGRRGVRPLALGTREAWMLSLLTFENILVSLAGPRFYHELFQGKGSPRAPEVRAAIEELGRLLDACNPDANRLSWDEAADRVRIGGAAMTLGGDWSKGYLERRGCLEGEHFAMVPSPGTERAFVMTIDAFGLPRGAPHREGAIDLLRVFGSPHGQRVFNRIKGSRAARADVHDADEVSPPSSRDFEAAVRVPTLTSLVPPSFSRAVDTALATFAHDRRTDAVLRVFEREYAYFGN
jgi:glucose/mannose transport system substrate-binding protein